MGTSHANFSHRLGKRPKQASLRRLIQRLLHARIELAGLRLRERDLVNQIPGQARNQRAVAVGVELRRVVAVGFLAVFGVEVDC